MITALRGSSIVTQHTLSKQKRIRSSAPYSSKIIKAGALIGDTKTLLSHWDVDAPVDENIKRAQRDNVFGKASRSRVEDILTIFRSRYLAEKSVTKALVTLVREKFPSPALERLFYFHSARADRLLYNTVTEVLAPRRARGLLDVVLEAANALCELNVSPQDRGCDLSVSFPVFANISQIRVSTPEKRIDVEVQRHRSFSSLRAVACLRGQTVIADAPFREQISFSTNNADSTRDEIVSAQGSVQIQDLDPDNDWLEVRIVHPHLGEVKKDSNYVRMFIPPIERNILLEAVVQQFCKGTTLDDLLTRAYNVQTAKLKPSAAFELHVSWLLGMFGLSTIVLGNYELILAPDTPVQRASVDILAASQRSKLLLLVSCTLNPPKPEDVNNLRYAREILARGSFAGTGVRVIPILFTSSMGGPSYYQSEDHFDWVPVVDTDSMEILLGLLRSGQESRFFEFLGNPTLGLTSSSQPR